MERTLQLAIETCLDVSQLLVKELKLGLPSEEENLLEKLEEAEVISEEMSLKLKNMKKFRNVLTHRYAKIDDSLVYEKAQRNSGDFLVYYDGNPYFAQKKKVDSRVQDKSAILE